MINILLRNMGVWRRAFVAGMIYIVFFVTAWLTNLSSPSGPCTPGLGLLMLFLLPLLNIIWLIIDLVESAKAQKFDRIILAHSIVLLFWMFMFFAG